MVGQVEPHRVWRRIPIIYHPEMSRQDTTKWLPVVKYLSGSKWDLMENRFRLMINQESTDHYMRIQGLKRLLAGNILLSRLSALLSLDRKSFDHLLKSGHLQQGSKLHTSTLWHQIQMTWTSDHFSRPAASMGCYGHYTQTWSSR